MALPLVNGIYVHSSLARVLMGEDLDGVLSEELARYREETTARGITGIDEGDLEFFLKEQCTLLEGLVRGWVKVRLPRVREEYDVVAVEQEVKWELAPSLIQMLRCDGILRRKSDGVLFILEFKTTAYPGYDWQQQWEHNIQLLSYTNAVTEVYGEPCGGVVIEGLVKGIRKLETAFSSPFHGKKIQNSPFCYLYQAEVEDSGTYVYSTEWKKGWKRVATWKAFADAKASFEALDDLIVENQFIAMPPICPLPEEMARWRRQTIAAETRFKIALTEVNYTADVVNVQEASGVDAWEGKQKLEELLDFHFPQHDNACRKYGGACSYMEVCFNPGVAEDPIGSGLYQRRTPHHSTELEEGT